MSTPNQESNVVTSFKNLTTQEAFKSMSLQDQREQFENFLAQVYYAQPHYILLVNGGSCVVNQNADGHFYLEHQTLGEDIHLTDIDEFISSTSFMSNGYSFECQLLAHILPHTR